MKRESTYSRLSVDAQEEEGNSCNQADGQAKYK